MIASRWNIVFVYLDPVVGREQAGNRPALIVSDDAFNQAMEVVTVLPITTLRPGRRTYLNEAVLPVEVSGLEQASIVLAHQIRTISQNRIKKLVQQLTDEETRHACLRAVQVHLGMYP
ncbi:MAG: type II toxin-antitoxin system PemK/MazF family toxin [Spirochaetaceae bacterium]|nr:MAG: type II toxin-antitoxin system PemK/MazF family toxin [Spirochaetaceae bacterium]